MATVGTPPMAAVQLEDARLTDVYEALVLDPMGVDVSKMEMVWYKARQTIQQRVLRRARALRMAL